VPCPLPTGLRQTVNGRLDKWAARGLNPDVLVAIRFENFSIQEPKP
jgi:hypothetical protein